MDWPCGSAAGTGEHPPIGVVMYGNETRPFTVEYNSDLKLWIGPWNGEDTFDATTAVASLRLGGARTECRRSVLYKIKERGNVALFTFPCTRKAAHPLEIDTDPQTVAIGYRRQVSKVTEGSADCNDRFFGGTDRPITIPDVWLLKEDLRVQLGWSDKKSNDQDPGLLVFTADSADSGLPLLVHDRKPAAQPAINPALKSYVRRNGDELSLYLDRTDVAHVLSRQHGPNRIGAVNSFEDQNARLLRAQLNGLTITVK